jgi:hypothetical protein
MPFDFDEDAVLDADQPRELTLPLVRIGYSISIVASQVVPSGTSGA